MGSALFNQHSIDFSLVNRSKVHEMAIVSLLFVNFLNPIKSLFSLFIFTAHYYMHNRVNHGGKQRKNKIGFL